MKPNLTILLAWLMLNCTTVTSVTPDSATDDLIIRSGTSFGFCLGYCTKTLELTANKAIFTNISRDQTKYPTKTCTGIVSETAWANLKLNVNSTAFSQQPEIIGCPDCADGGAEFVEIEQGGKKHRVTFEYGKTIPGFEKLVTLLRDEREKFKECK
jgi:hypothetical protein